MQIVIDISEKAYSYIKREWVENDFDSPMIHAMNGIKKGTPLPKGHGDLIDRSKIAFDYWSVDGHVCVWKQNVFNMPVVVPADKDGD